ncbi:unnamed protein product [Moneuplotes crassus]|uniref:Uncharacterized protein n=1 Tax=Euplotes crassus TaxID=5936 RepID=A0AAD1XK58_EUPCR|nr:unnamed protein product [Moneuplotes crassus]
MRLAIRIHSCLECFYLSIILGCFGLQVGFLKYFETRLQDKGNKWAELWLKAIILFTGESLCYAFYQWQIYSNPALPSTEELRQSLLPSSSQNSVQKSVIFQAFCECVIIFSTHVSSLFISPDISNIIELLMLLALVICCWSYDVDGLKKATMYGAIGLICIGILGWSIYGICYECLGWRKIVKDSLWAVIPSGTLIWKFMNEEKTVRSNNISQTKLVGLQGIYGLIMTFICFIIVSITRWWLYDFNVSQVLQKYHAVGNLQHLNLLNILLLLSLPLLLLSIGLNNTTRVSNLKYPTLFPNPASPPTCFPT